MALALLEATGASAAELVAEPMPQDLASARAKIMELQAKLRKEDKQEAELVAVVRDLSNATQALLPTTTNAPTSEMRFEEAALLLVVLGMLILCAIPKMFPCRKYCETRKYRFYPVITVVNLLLLAYTLNQLYLVSFNQCFFWFVKFVELAIDETEEVLIGIAALMGVAVVWKFKDRLLEALGVEHAAQVIGDFRDWATCWSMKRFHPVELFIWKVEGLPAAKLHTLNDAFCEVSLGYNVAMRTRVHLKAGHACVFKESVQMNFDPFDTKTKMTLIVKHQEAIGSEELAQLQMGALQVQRLEEHAGVERERGRTIGWASTSVRSENSVWKDSLFRPYDLVPAGRIWLRFAPVPAEDEPPGLFDCWPRRSETADAYGSLA